jgi:hypothetical protein
MYRQYLQGGPSCHGPNRNEFLFKKAQHFSDFVRLVAIVANYTFGSSLFYHTPHLEGEEVFGFAKQHADCLLGVENDFHRLDCVNFSHPRIIVPIAQPNVVGNVGMQQPPCGSSACSPLVS